MPKKTKKRPEGREIAELTLLFEVSRILDRGMDLREVAGPVLKAIAKHMGMVRGTLMLRERGSDEISIAEAYGLSRKQQKLGRYNIGEGVSGRVVQTGRPVVVPKISEEPMFLDRTGAREGLEKADISYICVPIKTEDEVVGALSADRLFAESVALEEDVRLLSIIASMIAQAVKLRQAAEAERQRLLEENVRLHEELKDRFRPTNILGNSKAMQVVYDLIDRVSKSDATVYIRGESGVGKELVAHAIHYNSLRAPKPFIKVNCAALPDTIIESELFGHEEGAFTGAVKERQGRFQLANGGTLFLDEIGDLSASTQIRLLRVLQEREFERVGGTETIKVDVRLIVATNKDLEKLVNDGEFRQDLYYRLDVFPIHVPPLRERKADIMLLADHFVERYGKANNKPVRRISTPAIDMMMSYHWPGNVRELENCIERAVILSTDDVIHGHHLPPTLQTSESSSTQQEGTLQEALDNLEQEMLLDALKSTRGNKAKAAQALGLTERIIGLRVQKYGINPKRFRS